jgi:hypothetical protein
MGRRYGAAAPSLFHRGRRGGQPHEKAAQTREIEGLPREESDAILQKLFDHQEQPKFVYEHVWRPADILMWDNRCTRAQIFPPASGACCGA